jgi:hypothetical protein
MRLNILRRLKVPKVAEIEEDALRTQRVFEAGHIFHEWAQRITKNTGLSIAQELELQDESMMVRGHIDDLVLVGEGGEPTFEELEHIDEDEEKFIRKGDQHLILYDYKTANSQSFNYKKDEIGHYHKMQLGTYMYMLKKGNEERPWLPSELREGRILTISKDDLRMREHQLIWSLELEAEVTAYWGRLNGFWKSKTLPPCTCHVNDGGFMGKRSKKGKVYNDYFYEGVPCSLDWVARFEEVKEFIK